MLSKKIRWSVYIVSTLLLLVLSNCSYFFDEKAQEEVVNYNKEVGSCINQANATILEYFKAEGREVKASELDAFSECYKDSIETIVKHTKSGRPESENYTPENIESLIQRFHAGQGLNVARIRGYFMLKSFFIGGQLESISKEELKVLQELVPLLGEALKALLPYRKTLLWQVTLTPTEDEYHFYNAAMGELRHQLKLITRALDQYSAKRSGNLEEMVRFVLSEFYGENTEDKLKYFPLIVNFKNLVLAEEGTQIERQHFSEFVEQATLIYDSYTRYSSFLEKTEGRALFENFSHIVSFISRIPSQLLDSSLFKGVGLRVLDDILNSTLELIKHSIEIRPRKRLPYQKLTQLMYSLEEADVIQKPLTAKTLDVFLTNFMTSWVLPLADTQKTLTLDKLGYIRYLVDRWFHRQQIINTLFELSGNQPMSLTSPRKELRQNAVLDEWVKVLQQVNVHRWDELRRMQIGGDLENLTYEELTASNSISLIVEVFMKPFNRDKKDILQYTVTSEQAQDIYELMRVLGVELAFMDSRVNDSGFKAFEEMNNFSTQKRSFDNLDFFEGYEYLSFATSAGELSDTIYADIPGSCFIDYKDVLRHEVIDKTCFLNHFKNNFHRYFSHLPSVHNYWVSVGNDEKEDFLKTLEISSRVGVVREKYYDLSEIRVMVSLLTYLESIFFSFDTRAPYGFIDGVEIDGSSELWRAERHFRTLIQDFVTKYKPTLIEENRKAFTKYCGEDKKDDQILTCITPVIFIHLLREGNLPLEKTDTCSKISFGLRLDKAHNRVNRAFRNTSVTPREVLQVFSAIAELTLGGRRKGTHEFLKQKRVLLAEALEKNISPDCQVESDHVFCKWARLMYCTDAVTDQLFDVFRAKREHWFLRDQYKTTSEEAIDDTILYIHEFFDSHEVFDTQCSFPVFEDQPRFPWWDEMVETKRKCTQ